MLLAFGLIFILLGLPLLNTEQNSTWIILQILGCMFLSIGTMVVYVVVIEPRYRAE